MKKIKLSDNEKKILEIMAESYDSSGWGETGYFHFAGLIHKSNLDRRHVRLACRSLARKGMAEYLKGLWSDDGPAGAGYGATEKGAAFISPCDVCGKLAHYDYNVENDGTLTGNDDDKTRQVLECEEHYKKSPNLQPKLI